MNSPKEMTLLAPQKANNTHSENGIFDSKPSLSVKAPSSLYHKSEQSVKEGAVS